MRTGLEYIDGQLVGVRDRMAEAKADDNTTRAEVLRQVRFNIVIHTKSR